MPSKGTQPSDQGTGFSTRSLECLCHWQICCLFWRGRGESRTGHQHVLNLGTSWRMCQGPIRTAITVRRPGGQLPSWTECLALIGYMTQQHVETLPAGTPSGGAACSPPVSTRRTSRCSGRAPTPGCLR